MSGYAYNGWTTGIADVEDFMALLPARRRPQGLGFLCTTVPNCWFLWIVLETLFVNYYRYNNIHA